ncbi:MAG: hypothetical protein M1486_07255 [Gammaproteobacteria bacterium]|nr:hypothetical protein [Gammaproteobacteria bacterium]
MSEKKIHIYFITVFIGILFAHIVFSFTLGLLTNNFYKNTLINARNYEGKELKPISRSYLTSFINTAKKPIILIMGSSFSYGNSLPADETYANYMRHYFSDYFIMNASIIGESGEGIRDNLYYLKTKKLTVDTLVIEINLFNFTSSNSYHLDLETLSSKDMRYSSFFNFYLLHPHGVNSLMNLDLNRLYVLDNKSSQFQWAQLPDSYSIPYNEFKNRLPNYTEFLSTLFNLSSSVAHHVYFFVSPIYKNGVERTQFKVSDIQNELNDIDKICKQFPKIHCLAPSLDYSESNFMNLSHFNEQGHRNLAKHLAEQIKKNKEHQLTQVDLNEPVS